MSAWHWVDGHLDERSLPSHLCQQSPALSVAFTQNYFTLRTSEPVPLTTAVTTQLHCPYSALKALLSLHPHFSLPSGVILASRLSPLQASTDCHNSQSKLNRLISFLLLLQLQNPSMYHSELKSPRGWCPLLWSSSRKPYAFLHHRHCFTVSPFLKSKPTCILLTLNPLQHLTSWENWGLVTELPHLPFSPQNCSVMSPASCFSSVLWVYFLLKEI